jgi:hypothetical protein
MSMPRRAGRPRSDERIRVPPGWLPPHVAVDPKVDALDLVRIWRCLKHEGRHIEAREALNRLQAMAERAPAGQMFRVRRPR